MDTVWATGTGNVTTDATVLVIDVESVGPGTYKGTT